VFPKLQDNPPIADQIILYPCPPLFVGVQLFSPKCNVALWLPVALNAAMPKASVDEHGCLPGLAGKVWFSENCFVVNSVSLSFGPQKFPYCCLGLCVFGFNA
jgi:hypothetical protein